MLSIGKLTGPDSERYYTQSVATGREDYYAGRGEAPGYWAGSGIDELHESDNEVSSDALSLLLAGRSPTSGDLLSDASVGRKVSGFDLTFQAPKSVSVLYGIGDPAVAAEARQAHDDAVADALAYLEREACWTRRGKGGRRSLSGSGFIAAAFRHRTSRAGDPSLHTHVVVGNLTEAEGRWSALDARHLYRHAKTASYLYQAALRAQLTKRLGVQWTVVTNGTADVLGVPRQVIEHFSRRRAEILEHMAARGLNSARAAQVATLETRRRKELGVPVDRLRADWRARAEEHGFGADQLRDLMTRTERFPEEQLSFVRDAVDGLALDELTREASTFDRRDVLRAWAARQRAGARVAEIEQAADAWLASDTATPLEPCREGPWERRFSTPQMLETEQELLRTAVARRREGAGLVSQTTIDGILATRSELSDEQAAMVRSLTTSGDGVQVVRAAAGTGKTYALDVARQAWEADGLRVFGCALSARAAVELRDQAGIDTSTVARLQLDLRHGYGLTPNSVLVVDEAGTVGTRDLAELARHADQTGAKLLLVGDDRQLPEIEAGGAFRGLASRLGAVELREVRRQVEAWDRTALNELREGRIEGWLETYREHERIRGAHDAAGTRAQLVEDWHAARCASPNQDSVMIAHRRSDVADLNDRARKRLRAAGLLPEDGLEVGQDDYCVGDRVIACRNDARTRLANGMRGTVAAIDRQRRGLSVAFDGGFELDIQAGYLDDGHLEHGYAMTAHRAQGTTVDRAFVLGSDELYREWGYTALTRHREEARFYVNLGGGQLAFEGFGDARPDLAEDVVNPLLRSRAKGLATDFLEQHVDTLDLDI